MHDALLHILYHLLFLTSSILCLHFNRQHFVGLYHSDTLSLIYNMHKLTLYDISELYTSISVISHNFCKHYGTLILVHTLLTI